MKLTRFWLSLCEVCFPFPTFVWQVILMRMRTFQTERMMLVAPPTLFVFFIYLLCRFLWTYKYQKFTLALVWSILINMCFYTSLFKYGLLSLLRRVSCLWDIMCRFFFLLIFCALSASSLFSPSPPFPLLTFYFSNGLGEWWSSQKSKICIVVILYVMCIYNRFWGHCRCLSWLLYTQRGGRSA